MNDFLAADHPDAFTDFPVLAPRPDMGLVHLCPVCKGHGGRNLTLLAYRGPENLPDTAENRHLYRHFKQGCSQCNGWGYVANANECIHDYHRELSQTECAERGIYHAGACWHVRECRHCHETVSHDSSD